MRCKNIKISLEIPVKVNEPDGNGIVYTEEVIKKACEKAGSKPIMQYNGNSHEKCGFPSIPARQVIGVVDKAEYRDGKILVEGRAFYGGTEEQVDIKDGKVVSMSITGFGITL